MFPPLLHPTIFLVLSFAGGFTIRLFLANSALSSPTTQTHLKTRSATSGNIKSDASPPWNAVTPLHEIWEAIDPQKGDPALSVRAVMDGILTRKDLDPDMAAGILGFALSEDPEGVTAYVLQALQEGKLDFLQTRLTFPPLNHPTFPKLLAGYAKAFSAGWEASAKPLPFSLRRLRYFRPAVFQNCISALAEAGPDPLRLAATLYPAEIAARPDLIVPSLDLLKKPEARLALLRAAFAAPGAQPVLLAASCRAPSEWLLADLLSGTPLPSLRPAGPDITGSELQTLLDILHPSETLYRNALSLGETPISTRMKTEIIRKLTETNLVAATRALASEPLPPDEAIAIAVTAMEDDPASAQAWTARIRDPEIRARFPTPPTATAPPPDEQIIPPLLEKVFHHRPMGWHRRIPRVLGRRHDIQSPPVCRSRFRNPGIISCQEVKRNPEAKPCRRRALPRLVDAVP